MGDPRACPHTLTHWLIVNNELQGEIKYNIKYENISYYQKSVQRFNFMTGKNTR